MRAGLYCFERTQNLLFVDVACPPRAVTVDDADLMLRRRQVESIEARLEVDDTPDARVPLKVGSILEYDNGDRFEVVAVHGSTTTVIDQAGLYRHLVAGLYEPWLVVGVSRDIHRLWPLAAGKEITGFGTEEGRSFDKVVVVRQERVEVPAGTFDAWVIERRLKIEAENGRIATMNYWFAPSLGTTVKCEGDPAAPCRDRSRSWRLAGIRNAGQVIA